MDSFGRTIDYLRISVTDRCNERCLYCMPEGYAGWAEREDHLSADEILRVVEVATKFDFRKFRLTGGEPLVRCDIVEIAQRIWELPGVETLGLSTNGLRLSKLAAPLKQAGVRTVNISIDTLDAAQYQKLTGGRLSHVLDGIHSALAAGFEAVKLNTVLMRGINEDQIVPLAQFAAQLGCPLRFIELMPIGPEGPINDSHFFSISEAMAVLGKHDEFISAQHRRIGHGPARYFQLKKLGGLVGFIGAMTCADFCDSCNKMRLTSDGKIRPCLGHDLEIDLKPALRTGIAHLEELMAHALAKKPEKHVFAENPDRKRPMTAMGG